MAFDAKQHLMQIKGKDYLPVVWRVYWFREKFPHGKIVTEEVYVDLDAGYARFKATVENGQGGSATGIGTAMREKVHPSMAHCFAEIAETSALGRALGFLGIGTEFVVDDLSEGEQVVDSPIERKAGKPRSPQAPGAMRPTLEQINALFELARSAGMELKSLGIDLRRVMDLPAETQITKQFLTERMTMSQYQVSWDHYADLVKQQVAEEVGEDDVPNYDPPQLAQIAQTAPITDEPVHREGSTDDRAPEGQPDGKNGESATDAQMAELETLAQRVGKDAEADLQDAKEHHRGSLPLNVFETIEAYLQKRLATAATATAKGGARG